MPLTKKGKKIMKSMREQYGDKKGESVFYASANKGKIKNVHGKKEGGVAERKVKVKPVPMPKYRPKGKSVPMPKFKPDYTTTIPKKLKSFKEGGVMEPYHGSFISGTVDGKQLSNPSYRKYYGSLLKGMK